MGVIKNDNYVTIQGWMINDLQLTGNELMAYAVIYGFSQVEGQYMSCSQEYIAAWLNISREATNRLIKRLIEKGLVIKRERSRKGAMVLWEYKAVRPEDRKSTEPKPEQKNEKKSTPKPKTKAAVQNNTPKAEVKEEPEAEPKKKEPTALKLKTKTKEVNIPLEKQRNKNRFNVFRQQDYDFGLIEEILTLTG